MKQVDPGVYQHYRKGRYTVILNTVAHHDVEGQDIPRVVYVAHDTGETYDCTLEHFTATVKADSGAEVPRFTRVAAKEV